jgi:hypothetical protein
VDNLLVVDLGLAVALNALGTKLVRASREGIQLILTYHLEANHACSQRYILIYLKA